MAKQELPKRGRGRPAGSADSYQRTKIKKASNTRKLGRKISEYIDDALRVAAEIMGNVNAADKDRLAAAKMFIERFATMERDIAVTEQWMNKPIETPKSEGEVAEDESTGAVFNLNIIKKTEDTNN